MPMHDEEGYLVDPSDWTEDWATETARSLQIELCADHWVAIRFMREWYQEHQTAPDARHVMRHLQVTCGGDGRKRMYELFPFGYVAQACKIAGMKRPRAWSTG